MLADFRRAGARPVQKPELNMARVWTFLGAPVRDQCRSTHWTRYEESAFLGAPVRDQCRSSLLTRNIDVSF